jgi:GTP cyclohydrolase IB
MTLFAESPHHLPDVAIARNAQVLGALDEVGMGDIAAPIMIGAAMVPARIDIAVNLLDAAARGIHMSRLYALINGLSERGSLTPPLIHALLDEMLASHHGLSDRAKLKIEFALLLRRPALISGQQGWRSYPVTIAAQRGPQGVQIGLTVEVLYASTCPSSAALARQLVQQQFQREFPTANVDAAAVHAWLGTEQGMLGTPHAQRSAAVVSITLAPHAAHFDFETLINQIEAALRTPVQAAVKRADEQAFAQLNGQNLMFCEDAARRLQALLYTLDIHDFEATVTHFESLHAHNAVATVRKR